MSEQNSRRQFLAAVVLGSAGVVSASALAGVTANAATVPPAGEQVGPNEPDPNFLQGQVVSVGESELMVLTDNLVLRRVLATGAVVWKIRHTTLEHVQRNDFLYARGAPMEDGSFAAAKIWVNIVNLHFEVASTAPGRMELRKRGNAWIGHLHPDTTVHSSGRAPSRDLSGIRAGSHVQVVGAWRPQTNEIDISKVFA